jgi:hypothetical protein
MGYHEDSSLRPKLEKNAKECPVHCHAEDTTTHYPETQA